ARNYFKNKNVQAGKRHLEEYLNFLITLFGRNQADFSQFQRRVELVKVAAEYARAGLQTESLECLGRHADLQVTRNYATEGAGRASAAILSGLGSIQIGRAS